MRARSGPFILALLAALALMWPAQSAEADAPPEISSQTALELLPPADGQRSVILSARLSDAAGQPLSGVPLSFYILTDVFGQRLMKVGESLTDTTGTAWLVYRQTWVGEHTAVARFEGTDGHAAAQGAVTFFTTEAAPDHVNAPFGLEPVRRWLPVAVTIVLVAVWVTLGLVLTRTVWGIPAAVRAPAPTLAPLTVPVVVRPVSLGRAWVLAAAALLVAAPVGWLLLSQRGEEEATLTAGPILGEASAPVAPGAGGPSLVAPVRSVPLPASQRQDRADPAAEEPGAIVTVMGDRAFVLDAPRGVILATTAEGGLTSVFDATATGGPVLRAASAITAYEGTLYVASSLEAEIVVLAPSGEVERVIVPQLPPGRLPLRIGGLAVAAPDRIWLSDVENNQIILVGEHGELLRAIGQPFPSSGEYGFNAPGALALDAAGNLYAVDRLNGQLKKYSPLGIFLEVIGGGTDAQSPIPQARDLAVDEAGRIFVSDGQLSRVQVFSPDGELLGSVGRGSLPQGEAQSWSPYGIETAAGSLYVMDGSARLLIFSTEGIAAP